MVAFDASMLIDLFNPKLNGERRQRLDLLVKNLTELRQKIVVPAPAYTEFMVGAIGARDDYQARIDQTSSFRVEPFDKKASVECAFLLSKALTSKDRGNITKTKFKFDWMIVAVAKTVPGLKCIYCGDDDVMRYASRAGIDAVHVDALPLPAQTDWIGSQGDQPAGNSASE